MDAKPLPQIKVESAGFSKPLVIILALTTFLLPFLLRLPLLGFSPLHSDVALLLVNASELTLGRGKFPIAEISIYRPTTLLFTWWALALFPAPITPEKSLLVGALVSLLFTGLTTATLALYLYLRFCIAIKVVLAAILCWLLLPGILPFCADGLVSTPAIFFGLLAFVAVDLAVLCKGGRAALVYALAGGILLFLAFLTRSTFVVMGLPCALRLLGGGSRWCRLSVFLVGAALSGGLWLLLEKTVFHPQHPLALLFSMNAMPLCQSNALLLSPAHWGLVLELLVHSLGYGLPVLAMICLCRRREALHLPLLCWVLLFLVFQLRFFNPGTRYFGAIAIPVILLALPVKLAGRRPGLVALIFVGLAGLAALFSFPTAMVRQRLPHDQDQRALHMGALATPDDVVLCLGGDESQARWRLPDHHVVALFELIPLAQKVALMAGDGYSLLGDPERANTLLRQVLIPYVKLAGSTGRSFLIAPEPELTEVIRGLTTAGIQVSELTRIPPGSSHSQGDTFAQDIGYGDPVSRREVCVFRLSAAKEGM